MTVLITGGAGYIGSHMAWMLEDTGRDYVILDDLSRGFTFLVPKPSKLIVGDIADLSLVRHLIGDYGISLILHFAGSTSISELVADPLAYYENNTAKSKDSDRDGRKSRRQKLLVLLDGCGLRRRGCHSSGGDRAALPYFALRPVQACY